MKHRPGLPHGKGRFVIRFDVDLIWPFKRKNQTIKFGIREARLRPEGGIDRLVVGLYGKSAIIKQYDVSMEASGTENASAVDFVAEVKLQGFIDTFFPLSVYRRNIEYRIVKVIANLREFLEK